MDFEKFFAGIRKMKKKGAKFDLRDYEFYKSVIKYNSSNTLEYEMRLKELTKTLGV